MSGWPGRSLRCSRKRYPIEYSIRRTASSGFVSLPRIRLIKRLRASGLKVSAIPAKNCPGFCKNTKRAGAPTSPLATMPPRGRGGPRRSHALGATCRNRFPVPLRGDLLFQKFLSFKLVFPLLSMKSNPIEKSKRLLTGNPCERICQLRVNCLHWFNLKTDFQSGGQNRSAAEKDKPSLPEGREYRVN